MSELQREAFSVKETESSEESKRSLIDINSPEGADEFRRALIVSKRS